MQRSRSPRRKPPMNRTGYVDQRRKVCADKLGRSLIRSARLRESRPPSRKLWKGPGRRASTKATSERSFIGGGSSTASKTERLAASLKAFPALRSLLLPPWRDDALASAMRQQRTLMLSPEADAQQVNLRRSENATTENERRWRENSQPGSNRPFWDVSLARCANEFATPLGSSLSAAPRSSFTLSTCHARSAQLTGHSFSALRH